MELVPVVFFGLYFLYLLNKRGLDVSTFVSLLYLITSVFSLVMFQMNLVEEKYSHPSFFATLTYCLLLFLSIQPLYRIDFRKINLNVTAKTGKIIKSLTYVFLFNLVLFLFLKLQEINQIIMNGDYLALRQDIMSEDDQTASGFMGLLIIITNILSSISFVMIFIFFISITYYKNSWWFNLFAFLGSLPQVLGGILTVNRSNVFYYVIIFALSYIMFQKRISTKIKLRFFLPVGTALVAMMMFFSSVTVSRFDNTNSSYGSVDNSLISYAGMSYSNYCYFFDYYNNPDWLSTRYLLPVTNFVLKGYRSGVEREQEQTERTGFNCVAFMTFLGSFIMDSNQVMPFIFVIIYLLLFRLCRNHVRQNTISFAWLLAVFLLAIVPSVGCISYFYTNPFKSLALYALLFYVFKK